MKNILEKKKVPWLLRLEKPKKKLQKFKKLEKNSKLHKKTAKNCEIKVEN